VARKPSYDIIRFSREAAVLDAEGNFSQDPIVLKSWGLMDRYIRRNFKTGVYPNREELPLKQKIKPLWKEGKISVWDKPPKPIIYMMPNGKYCGHLNYNPFGFFHDLDRRNNKQIRKERIAKRASRRTTIKKTNKQVRREREARAKYYNSRQK
jgi:hypothetical protein